MATSSSLLNQLTESGAFDALPARLRGDVRRLGTLLGKVIADARGSDFVETIESIRSHAKDARSSRKTDWTGLTQELTRLSSDEVIDVARAFNQFLNLANLAEQKHSSVYRNETFKSEWDRLHRLRVGAFSQDLTQTKVELVLTAHPTEVLRRTLIRKYENMTQALHQADDEELKRLIAEAWHTDEIRQSRPTPLDEANWGFDVIENSLWNAIPALMRQIDNQLILHGESRLNPTCMPFKFSSWMGGDRDGNPNVTADTTRQVVNLSKRRAALIFATDVEGLMESLSMGNCSEELATRANQSAEPYRFVLNELHTALESSGSSLEDDLGLNDSVFLTDEQLLEPLVACYESLCECGLETIANGPLLDTIRRGCCFGTSLVNLDVRQHALRHMEVLDELTAHFAESESSYSEWNESERQQFLVKELESKRPLLPSDWKPSENVAEVLSTFELVAQNSQCGIANYIISMATQPSDILAVLVLLRASQLQHPVQVVPLFETLDDLNRSGDMLHTLLSIPAYLDYVRRLGSEQQVMIGYSDSAKDAGQFAAAWAQYQAQENLTRVASEFSVKLVLFHGRGGAIGRGGGPTHEAILAQPPGTVASSLRLTEQGEMIRFKLGSPDIAFETLARYLFATIEASHTMRSGDDLSLRQTVSELASQSKTDYRAIVNTTQLVSLFNQLTPESELAQLAIGSRPNRRVQEDRDVNSLRAIPWVFAWTQVRLMIPAWLGTLHVLEQVVEDETLTQKLLNWSFFRMQIELLEVMLAKVEPSVVVYYSQRLNIGSDEMKLLQELLDLYERSVIAMCKLRSEKTLLAKQLEVRDSLRVRNTYLDPLHLLQAELLSRYRDTSLQSEAEVEKALKVTMAGIASGLRNTG